MVHGFPKQLLSPADLNAAKVSDNNLRDLAANSFSTGACLSVLIGVLSVLPVTAWCEEDEEQSSSDSDVEEFVNDILDM